MSALFKTPKMPGPDPEIAKAQARQEERLEAEERQKMRALSARTRARRRGGMRQLLSPERETPQVGIEPQLGA